MGTKVELSALNANLTNGAIALTTSVATVTCGTAITNALVDGKFITTPLAATAVALAFVSSTDGTTSVTPTTLAALQGCIIVHCVNAAGARKEVQGPIVTIDASGNPVSAGNVFSFPSIPDTLTPIAYSTIKNITNPFIFGTTTWGAAGVTATTVQVATLPRRPLTS